MADLKIAGGKTLRTAVLLFFQEFFRIKLVTVINISPIFISSIHLKTRGKATIQTNHHGKLPSLTRPRGQLVANEQFHCTEMFHRIHHNIPFKIFFNQPVDELINRLVFCRSYPGTVMSMFVVLIFDLGRFIDMIIRCNVMHACDFSECFDIFGVVLGNVDI